MEYTYRVSRLRADNKQDGLTHRLLASLCNDSEFRWSDLELDDLGIHNRLFAEDTGRPCWVGGQKEKDMEVNGITVLV